MANTILFIGLGIIILSIAITLIRFVMGPSVLDRVVAFDVMGLVAISIISILAHLLGRFIYIDVALVYGLLSFLGVLVVARYWERGL